MPHLGPGLRRLRHLPATHTTLPDLWDACRPIIQTEISLVRKHFASNQETHALLGVHIIGTGATERVHIGQCAMAFKGTAEYFVNTVFNYPTLAEC